MRRSRPFFTRRLVVVFITVALLHVAMASTAEANHYDCVSNDCYGTVRWNGGVDGADARISVGTMTMNSSDYNWHINSVLWVRDRSEVTDCVVSGIPVDTAWVEVGVWARQYAQKFYWGDCRAGSTYYDGAWGFVNA
ncbi:MAG TPA: hypothetical protein PKA95_08170, partial [Thermomicrobiales bacterium]|nr:hypothetical protein [Thermomicrobiales bacterium]